MTPTWLKSVDISLAHRKLSEKIKELSANTWLSPGSLCYADVYRLESGRCRTLPFFLIFFKIYFLLIIKVLHEGQNISIKFPHPLLVYLCLSSGDLQLSFPFLLLVLFYMRILWLTWIPNLLACHGLLINYLSFISY